MKILCSILNIKLSHFNLRYVPRCGFCASGLQIGTWQCSQRTSPFLQAPLGFDKFGYSVRSRKGTKFHESIGKHYSDGYKAGDILGCMIVMPEMPRKSYLPPSFKDKPLVKFKSHLYFEEKDRFQENLKTLQTLPGGKIYFFKNGVPLGEAFNDIYQVKIEFLTVRDSRTVLRVT